MPLFNTLSEASEAKVCRNVVRALARKLEAGSSESLEAGSSESQKSAAAEESAAIKLYGKT